MLRMSLLLSVEKGHYKFLSFSMLMHRFYIVFSKTILETIIKNNTNSGVNDTKSLLAWINHRDVF